MGGSLRSVERMYVVRSLPAGDLDRRGRDLGCAEWAAVARDDDGAPAPRPPRPLWACLCGICGGGFFLAPCEGPPIAAAVGRLSQPNALVAGAAAVVAVRRAGAVAGRAGCSLAEKYSSPEATDRSSLSSPADPGPYPYPAQSSSRARRTRPPRPVGGWVWVVAAAARRGRVG